LQKETAENHEECRPRSAHKGDLPAHIPRWVAKEKDKRASQHIEAEPDELKKVGHYVRHFVVP